VQFAFLGHQEALQKNSTTTRAHYSEKFTGQVHIASGGGGWIFKPITSSHYIRSKKVEIRSRNLSLQQIIY